jgi:phospholipase/carboxylesterase
MTLQLGSNLETANAICIFLHGRGQSPEAMQEHVIDRLSTPGIAFLLPRAKTTAWYNAPGIAPLNDQTRQELAAAFQVIDELRHSLPSNLPLLLAGFSQGACLLIEYALQRGPWRGALACFTGCRVGVANDNRPLVDLTDLPVYLTGADADPWIPVENFSQAAGYFSKAHARLRVDCFPGRPHEVNDTEIAMLDHMLLSLSNNQPLWQGA